MPMRILAASVFTIAFLMSSLVFVVGMALSLKGAPTSSFVFLAVVGVLFSGLTWAFGPWFTDLIQSWFYKVERLEFPAFERRYPVVGRSMREICEREGLPLPAMRLIEDDNPTAYTSGSLPFNARVALSRGLFRFLDDAEVSAVAAHELGHIRHYDFLVMTIASVLLQLLYESYFWLSRSQRSEGATNRAQVALSMVAYALWWLGTYAVLYLSRAREYMADDFAARQLGDGAPLQRALVKIAYGLVELQQSANRAGTEPNTRLLQSTRALGIADPKAAAATGGAIKVAGGASTAHSLALHERPEPTPFLASKVEPVLRFDVFSPWASVTELGSTHPLTGKRLRVLDEGQARFNRPPTFRWDAIDASGQQIDQDRLYGDFYFELVIYFMPYLLPVLGLAFGIVRPDMALGLAVSFFGVGMIVRGLYTYGWMGEFEPATVYELLCDPYASPLRGRPVIVEGSVVGKGDAGSKLSEDVLVKDVSGTLVYLNFQSFLPVLGNWWFGTGVATKAIGQNVRATGWFRRSMMHHIDLNILQVGTTEYGSYTRFWGLSGGFAVLGFGLLLTLVGVVAGNGIADLLTDDGVEAYEGPELNDQGIQVW